ncbi:uncharacterized protein LOC117174313 isoform X1 [Belonocnema kinseyi]|uniref:uncharacterized protein LOC117174313 isoform X1 n=1 Tax=Belonocnema kinseyi TaxID=2817044 RepID=UPI00143D432E|nr:uncharacterized protein LOC117174313 isoform X1 [Belonocnema kinseyi]
MAIKEKGLDQELAEQFLKKYPESGILETPAYNTEIKFTLSESGQKRDEYFMEYQKRLTSVVVALGTALSTVLNNPTGDFDVREVIEPFSDAGRLMVGLHHQLTEARIAFIQPGLTKPVKNVIKENKTGKFLFGEKLSEQFKEVRSMEKMAQPLRKPPMNKFKTYKWPARQMNLNCQSQCQKGNN